MIGYNNKETFMKANTWKVLLLQLFVNLASSSFICLSAEDEEMQLSACHRP